jgi:hypothetical protein
MWRREHMGTWDAERCGMTVGFGVCEYTLVFRRTLDGATGQHESSGWMVVRPQTLAAGRPAARARTGGPDAGMAQILAVPICSALALEGVAYERFLLRSGVLDDVLRLLADMALPSPLALETARKQIQSLVMAAEVRHIVDGMSA